MSHQGKAPTCRSVQLTIPSAKRSTLLSGKRHKPNFENFALLRVRTFEAVKPVLLPTPRVRLAKPTTGADRLPTLSSHAGECRVENPSTTLLCGRTQHFTSIFPFYGTARPTPPRVRLAKPTTGADRLPTLSSHAGECQVENPSTTLLCGRTQHFTSIFPFYGTARPTPPRVRLAKPTAGSDRLPTLRAHAGVHLVDSWARRYFCGEPQVRVDCRRLLRLRPLDLLLLWCAGQSQGRARIGVRLGRLRPAFAPSEIPTTRWRAARLGSAAHESAPRRAARTHASPRWRARSRAQPRATRPCVGPLRHGPQLQRGSMARPQVEVRTPREAGATSPHRDTDGRAALAATVRGPARRARRAAVRTPRRHRGRISGAWGRFPPQPGSGRHPRRPRRRLRTFRRRPQSSTPPLWYVWQSQPRARIRVRLGRRLPAFVRPELSPRGEPLRSRRSRALPLYVLDSLLLRLQTVLDGRLLRLLGRISTSMAGSSDYWAEYRPR